MSRRLVPRDAAISGVAGALACLFAELVTWIARGPLGILNDFWIYWSAGAVLNAGGNAYDNVALSRAHDAAGLPGIIGGGYTYPLAFAEAMRPMAALPRWPRGRSSWRSAWWRWAWPWPCCSARFGVPLPAMLAMGVLGGLYTPISYGLWVGQANDLLLPAMALAYRGVGPGAALMVATVVKLYPATGFLALAGRADRLRQLALAAAAAAVLFAPDLLFGAGRGAGRVAQNLAADTYWSNQSVNGFLSRMAAFEGWPLRGLPVEAVDLAVVAALGVGVVLVLWRCRLQPWDGCLSLCLCFGVVAAPRTRSGTSPPWWSASRTARPTSGATPGRRWRCSPGCSSLGCSSPCGPPPRRPAR